MQINYVDGVRVRQMIGDADKGPAGLPGQLRMAI